MGRACKVPISTRRPGSVRGPVEAMEQFARDFPNGGFTMDDEPGSTLSLLYEISRRFTLRARAGDESAIDLVFTLRYD